MAEPAKRQTASTASSARRRVGIFLAVVIIAAAAASYQLGWFRSPPSSSHLSPGQVSIEPASDNRLRDLVVGIPVGNNSLAEARTAFAVDEKVILHGMWRPSRTLELDGEWKWYAPDGSLAYQSTLTVKKDWRNTWNTYRGPQPMPAGEWKVVVLGNGQKLGALSFKVVREESAIPVRAMAKAFDESKLSLDQASALALNIRAVIAREKSAERVASELPADIKARKIQLAVSLYRDGEKLMSELAAGANFEESTRNALAVIAAKPDLDPATTDIEMSVLHSALSIDARTGSVGSQLRGNVGFSLEVGDQSATLLPSTIFKMNLNEPVDILRQLSIDANLGESGWKDASAHLSTFKTQEYSLVHDRDEASELLNGRAVVRPEDLTYDKLLGAIDLMVRWYMTNQQPAGNYMYSFYPGKDEYPNDDWCLRVLNGVFVMTDIANARPDRPEIRESVKRAVELYRGALRSDGEGRAFVHWTKPRPDDSLGSTAFLMGAMAMLGDDEYRKDAERMALAIIAKQEDNGRFSTSFIGEDRDIDQQYYPGEAMLALMRYYTATKDERAKTAVIKAYDYYKRFWGSEKHGPFVPWQIRSFTELYRYEPEQKYVDYVFDLMDWMLDKMPPVSLDQGLARAGALRRMYASTGVYTEGLVAAYRMAVQVGDRKRIERYGRAAVGAIRYLVGLQYEPTDVYLFARPEKVLGALAMKPRDNELRLDFTYHGIAAVLAMTQFRNRQQWDELRKSH